MGGELYRYTLEEYKALLKEEDDLYDLWMRANNELQFVRLSDGSKRDVTDYIDSYLSLYRQIIENMEEPDAPWQGADADSFRETALSICKELKNASNSLGNAAWAIKKATADRRNEVQAAIWDCENNYNMTLEGNIVVQASNIFGFEVK